MCEWSCNGAHGIASAQMSLVIGAKGDGADSISVEGVGTDGIRAEGVGGAQGMGADLHHCLLPFLHHFPDPWNVGVINN